MKKVESFFPNAAVLVVEDYEFNLEIIVEMLRLMGIKADVATDGEEAVEIVKRKNFDLILMDVLMPKMDGYQATTIIRQLPIPQPIILALTASVLIQDKRKCQEAGMNDFINKPLQFDDLEKTLKKYLSEKLVSKPG